jgi:hypothetical protein
MSGPDTTSIKGRHSGGKARFTPSEQYDICPS